MPTNASLNPNVRVLVLSYNGRQLLQECLDSYIDNDYDNFAITVIDNGSTDDTRQFMEQYYPQIDLLHLLQNRGYSGGFNDGLKYAFLDKKADYVLITNNDVKADQKLISALMHTAQKDVKNGFVTGKVLYYDHPNIFQTVGKAPDERKWNGEHIGQGEIDNGQYDKEQERIFADDIYMLVSNQLYQSVGGYDETFQFQAEEFDWQARAQKMGFRVMYTPAAKLWHKDSMTIGKQSSFKAYFDARNPMLVILKHKTADYFRRYFWHHFVINVFRRSLVSIKKGRILHALKIWQGFLSGLIWGFKTGRFTMRHFVGAV